MSNSRTLERVQQKRLGTVKRTCAGRSKPFRRVLGVTSMLAETGAGTHRHAWRLHATKGRLTWRVPLDWKWRSA